MTVTAMARFSSSQICVMPTFSPTIALVGTARLSLLVEEAPMASHADAPPGPDPSGALVQLCHGVSAQRTPADVDWLKA